MTPAFNLTKIAGTAKQAGQLYGEAFQDLIRGFCFQETPPSSEANKLAQKCRPYIERFAPNAAKFLAGIAAGSGLKPEEVTRLSLHEELYHNRQPDKAHCTALIVSGSKAENKHTMIGQNWDWPPNMLPWPGVLETSIKGQPRVMSYHYPGLWNCCGVNSEGLALMWTGAGYFPPVSPKAGVPTYLLIAELLLQPNVAAALNYLAVAKRAGSFIFLLADRTGATAVVEATPNQLSVTRANGYQFRANLFSLPQTIKSSCQQKDIKKLHSAVRLARMKGILEKHERLSLQDFKRLLSASDIFVQLPLRSTTIDRIIADCKTRTLHIGRGGSSADRPWKSWAL